MSKKFSLLSLIIIIGVLFSGIIAVVQASPLTQLEIAPLSSLTGYTYQSVLEVHNNAATTLPDSYTVAVNLNTATLISQGRLQTNCDDLRITFNNSTETELDRQVIGCNTTATQVQFRTKASISANPATDTRYTLYYGNSGAGTPPQNPANIYAFYDNFQDGESTGWTEKGDWDVVLDGSNYVYRYTSGGANWALAQTDLLASDIDFVAKVRAIANPMTNWIGLAFRIQDANNFLTFYQSRDSSQFKYAQVVSDNHTVILYPSFTTSAATWYWIRLQALGNQVHARIWQDGSAEPTSWLISTTDNTYITQPNIGLTLYNHTTNADWDEVSVRRLVSVEPTVTISPWWDANYNYRKHLTITNTSATNPLPVHFSSRIVLDTTSLISTGQLQSNCNDLRIAYDSNLAPVEIDRVVEKCNSNQTIVWFALQRPIIASGTDIAYTLYYGNPSAVNPPSDGLDVFLFFEDWEQSPAHWTTAGGLDSGNTGTMGTSTINNSSALSPSNSQYFVTRKAGGDAWSGFIPVSPSTSYSFSVWAYTPSSNVCAAVGTYNYTSSHIQGNFNLWADNWPTPSSWTWRSSTFTTASDTAFIKIWDEIWTDCAGSPAYVDNLALRYAISNEPAYVLGDENTNLPAPVVSLISNNGPVNLGSPITVSANISIPAGSIASATLQILSPQSLDQSMTRISGDNSNGTWAGNFTGNQGGVYSYRVRAISSTGLTSFSAPHTFTVNDATPPVFGTVSIIDPILVKNTQTLSVPVTENGAISSVTLTVDGLAHPMTANGSLYSFSWQVNNTGSIPYTVTATNTSNIIATLNGSFISQPRDVDVCTWKGCRQGAASWSEDDGNNSCLADLATAGIKGTFFYNGNSTPGWFATYSAAGHEIASHTVGHPCNTPSCSPNCTQEALAAIPVDPATVTDYRLNQLEPNIAAIEAGTGKPVVSLAWPCGCTDPSRWTASQNYYLGARGYYWNLKGDDWQKDVNLPNPTNIWNLNAATTFDQTLIDRAYSEGKWATITSHGECDGIPYIGAQNTNGHLWVAPIGEVLKYISVRNASQFSNYTRGDRTISFDAAHTLTTFQPTSITSPTPYTFLPIKFDNPVTLKVHILDTDTVIGVTVGSNSVPYSVQTIEGTRYVTFDITLDASKLVVVNLAAPAPTVSNITDNPDPAELSTAVTVTATVIPTGSTTLSSVTLRVLSPEAHDYSMSWVSGGQYAATFTPIQVGTYSYQVIAANTEGGSTLSTPASITVRDTTPPISRSQRQSLNQVANSGTNTLSLEGFDLGSLTKAVLSTDESGTMQAFDWSVTNWWDQNWAHRQPVTLNELAGLNRSAELVDLLIDGNSHSGLTSCNELRVADATGNEIPVQVYGSLPSCHVLFQANVTAYSRRTYYVYYGNPLAPTPSYSSDLSVIANGNMRTIQNTYYDLDLDTSSTAGIITRIRLLQGSNTDLPLSTSSNVYWGWHHVCSSLDGNITGKGQCEGGNAQASGLTMSETLSGPLVREYVLTSIKGSATYTITFRFFANAPYYQYTLSRTGTSAVVMNNFWYLNGASYFGRIGAGTNAGAPYPSYNTYQNGTDNFRFVSTASINAGIIDGTNNDGSFIGGTAYDTPNATGLNLYVAAGSSPASASVALAPVANQLSISILPPVENAPAPVYGSPFYPSPGNDWVPMSFTWQNPAILNKVIHWRVTLYDASGNSYFTTPDMSFNIGTPTSANLNYFRARKTVDGVQLSWETVSEATTAGFNLYRREAGGDFILINESLIPPQVAGQPMGSAYTYLDTGAVPGQLYDFKLEVIETSLQVADSVLVTYWPYSVTLPLVVR